MVDGIAMALGSLKAASDLGKSLIELRDAAKIGEVAIELNGKIAAAQQLAIAAQGEQAALVKRIDDLEKELMRFEDWESEKQRYELHDFGGSTFAYRLKEGMENGEPFHRLCANCYQERHKSILQFDFQDAQKRDHYRCQRCNLETKFGQAVRWNPPPARDNGWGSF